MKIKICGLTRRQDAQLAADLGADALGFVVTSGLSRSVAPEHVPALVPEGVPAVLVFRSPSVEQIGRAITLSGVAVVQLHTADPDVIAAARSLARVVVAHDQVVAGTEAEPCLLDVAAGGSGRRFDWTTLAPRAPRYTWIAGGITPENVWDLMRYIPWGIDVSSGVEGSPGIKDETKLRRLFSVRDT